MPAFDAYRTRLVRDLQDRVAAPVEQLKERYEKIGVSEVGWLAHEGGPPPEDGTAAFLELIDALEARSLNSSLVARLERKISKARAVAAFVLSEISPEFGVEQLRRGDGGGDGDVTALALTPPAGSYFGDLAAGGRDPDRLDDFCYLLVPGLLAQYSPPVYFYEALQRLRVDLNLRHVRFVQLNSEAGVAPNAEALREAILRANFETGCRVVVVGHSKGGVDAAAALALYPDDLQSVVLGLVCVQSPFGGARGPHAPPLSNKYTKWDTHTENYAWLVGSPIAADLLEDAALRASVEFLMDRVLLTKSAAVHDLTYAARQAFVRQHPLPPSLPVVCFHSQIDSDKSKLSPFFIPASYIARRYGARSDGLVCCGDAEVPGCLAVRMGAATGMECDHLGAVYPQVNLASLRKALGLMPASHDNGGAAAAAAAAPSGGDICEALVRLLIQRANGMQK
jgi:hypothetical protein